MEKVKMNENATINDEQLEEISGGFTPVSLGTGRCAVCGKLTPNLNLIDHHRQKICRSCLKKITNE